MAALLPDTVIMGKTYSPLLIFALFDLSDHTCENVQEQAEWHYTNFVLSFEDSSADE